MTLRLVPISIAAALAFTLSACQQVPDRMAARHNIPINPQLMALMSEKGMSPNSPVLIRSFKKESELEIWKKDRTGRYALLKTYPICRWSGQLGPKIREGDRQAPEGFYNITPAQMNPNSSFYLSFNMGFPNAYDRQFGRTGAHLMVHGACSSMGCYSMSDDQIAEIYALVREAHNGGQRAVQMQALPFRMTPANLARHRYNANMNFWRNLKEGSDAFEVSRLEPRVSICQTRYAFNRAGDCSEDPAMSEVASAAAEKRRQDEARVAELVREGTPAVRLVYHDGGQHQRFTEILMAQGPEGLERHAAWGSRPVGISRPEAILAGPQEYAMSGPASGARTAAAPASQPEPRATRTAAAQPETPARATTAQRSAPAPTLASTPAAATSVETAATASTGGFWQAMTSINPFAGQPAAQPAAAPVPVVAPTPPRRAETTPARPGARNTPQASATDPTRRLAAAQN